MTEEELKLQKEKEELAILAEQIAVMPNNEYKYEGKGEDRKYFFKLKKESLKNTEHEVRLEHCETYSKDRGLFSHFLIIRNGTVLDESEQVKPKDTAIYIDYDVYNGGVNYYAKDLIQITLKIWGMSVFESSAPRKLTSNELKLAEVSFEKKTSKYADIEVKTSSKMRADKRDVFTKGEEKAVKAYYAIEKDELVLLAIQMGDCHIIHREAIFSSQVSRSPVGALLRIGDLLITGSQAEKPDDLKYMLIVGVNRKLGEFLSKELKESSLDKNFVKTVYHKISDQHQYFAEKGEIPYPDLNVI